MTFRIETVLDVHGTILRLIGRIRSDGLDELRQHIRLRQPVIALDLDQVNLVDVGAVRFLGDAERAGLELRDCPAFVREWISRECCAATGDTT